MPEKPHVLIVDDSPTQLKQIQLLLEGQGYTVVSTEDGQQAFESVLADPPMLVVTDLQMPRMNGLELVAQLRATHPCIPVILTTSQGSEEIAAEALAKGASSYVPKHMLMKNLVPTVQQVMSVIQAQQTVREIARYVISSTVELCLDNDELQIPHVIARLEQPMVEMDLFDEGERMQIAMALDEALLNAMIHGNLQVSSDLRQAEDGKAYVEQIAERKQTAPYCDRRVHVSMAASTASVSFVIRDEGPGFDPSVLCDPTDPDNLEKAGGRGLLLINAFMDEVSHNDSGNQITMIKSTLGNQESAT